MQIVFWLIVGLIAGATAKIVIPGSEAGGWVGSIVIGLVGSLIGGFLSTTFGTQNESGWVGTTIVAFLGAVVLLFTIRTLSGRRA